MKLLHRDDNMYRIILMVIRLWYKVPYYMLGIW